MLLNPLKQIQGRAFPRGSLSAVQAICPTDVRGDDSCAPSITLTALKAKSIALLPIAQQSAHVGDQYTGIALTPVPLSFDFADRIRFLAFFDTSLSSVVGIDHVFLLLGA